MGGSIMNRKNILFIVVIFTFLIGSGLNGIISPIVNAEETELSGEEIMEKVYNREEGDDRESTLKMVLINKHGSQRVREIKQFNKTFENVEKKIMFFLSPQDVRGTSFMNWSYQDGRDDSQWIYLPALRKVKRISAENKSDYFMGSDFTYDDMGDRQLEEDKHRLLRIEEIDGEAFYVVESIPINGDYIYSKTISWVIKDKWVGLKKEFYDQKGNLLKELKVKEYQEIDGILTTTESEMENLQNGHRTQIILSDIVYNTGIDENKFTERNMKLGL